MCFILFFFLHQVQAYLYDFQANKWTRLEDMQTPRYYHGCGLGKKSDGTAEAIVVGGNNLSNVEILNLESLTWR